MILQFFNLLHILYIVISIVISVGVLILAKLFIKTQKAKDIFFKVCAWTVFLLHISIMWVEFLINGTAVAYDNILFPIYFCNLSMYLFFALSFVKNRQSRIFKILATYVAYAGIIGGLVTTIYPDYFLNRSFFEWEVFKSLTSHSILIIGCAYLFVGGYVKIRVYNVFRYAIGLFMAGIIGLVVNLLFFVCGLEMPNAMYLLHPPIAEVPFLNAYVIALLMFLLIFIFTALWEQFAIKQKQERWYSKIASRKNKLTS